VTKWFPFREGPFLLTHTDRYCSKTMIDTDYYVLSVTSLENAIVGTWGVVEFNKQLSIVPFWLYEGRIGSYDRVLEDLLQSR
jgi:hypothetical protein